MKGTSFREILAEFLDEETTNPAPSQSEPKKFQPEPPPLLQWKNQNLRQIPKGGYPKSARSAAVSETGKILPLREEKPARTPAPERLFNREQLSAVGRDALHTLLALGAVELKGDIALSLVKKAHRRLAKALHPDRIQQNLPMQEKLRRREQFLLLQAAYETLSAEVKALEAKSSGSACGSGSASGQGSPHQDAA